MLPGLHLEVIEYWEFWGPQGDRIDNAITTENRKDFFLFKVIGKKVIATERSSDEFHIKFEGGWMFVIHFEPKAQIDKREEERKKCFGDLTQQKLVPRQNCRGTRVITM